MVSMLLDCYNTVIRNCIIGPNVRAEGIDIKEGTLNTLVEKNKFDATGISAQNYADSFIDLKGARVIISVTNSTAGAQ